MPFNVGRLPDWVSFSAGATIGVGGVTAAGALYDCLAIPWPQAGIPKCIMENRKQHTSSEENRPWILIWGASCVTGMMAVQFAKLSGLQVFAVAGLHNASVLYSMGADIVVDRHMPNDAVAEARGLDIRLGIDCVGQETATHAAKALQPGSKLTYLVKKPNDLTLEETNVETVDVLIKRFHEDEMYGRAVVELISSCLFSKEIRSVPYELLGAGLGAVENGLQRLREQQVSGRKLVIMVDPEES